MTSPASAILLGSSFRSLLPKVLLLYHLVLCTMPLWEQIKRVFSLTRQPGPVPGLNGGTQRTSPAPATRSQRPHAISSRSPPVESDHQGRPPEHLSVQQHGTEATSAALTAAPSADRPDGRHAAGPFRRPLAAWDVDAMFPRGVDPSLPASQLAPTTLVLPNPPEEFWQSSSTPERNLPATPVRLGLQGSRRIRGGAPKAHKDPHKMVASAEVSTCSYRTLFQRGGDQTKQPKP